MSVAYYNLIGKRMLESVRRFFKGPIQIYTEDYRKLKHPTIEILPLSYQYYEFIEKNTDSTNDPSTIAKQASKFAPKAYAIISELNRREGYSFWLDADTYMFQGLDDNFFKITTAEDVFISYLARPQHQYMCSSMMMFNCSHPSRREFQRKLIKMYSEGELYNLPEWHDAYVLDHGVIRQMDMKTISLSDDKGSDYPCIHGKLGKYFDHLRGKRKYDPNTYREKATDPNIVPMNWKPEWNVYRSKHD